MTPTFSHCCSWPKDKGTGAAAKGAGAAAKPPPAGGTGGNHGGAGAKGESTVARASALVARCQRLEQENEELAASADVAKGKHRAGLAWQSASYG